ASDGPCVQSPQVTRTHDDGVLDHSGFSGTDNLLRCQAGFQVRIKIVDERDWESSYAVKYRAGLALPQVGREITDGQIGAISPCIDGANAGTADDSVKPHAIAAG